MALILNIVIKDYVSYLHMVPEIEDEVVEYACLQEAHLVIQLNSSLAGAVLRVNLIDYI